MRLVYSIGILFYSVGIRIAALFGHRNARLMVAGWKRWSQEVAKLSHQRPTAWFHAASLGEFEQARPVLEEYRRRHPDHQILVTFFSPSGYEVRKNYALADAICYLPMDTPRNVRRFVSAAHPDKVFFVKYEFWYNYLNAIKNWGAKTYIFSSIFRPGQYFFRWYGGWFRRQLGRCFDHLFVQNEESLQLLRSHGIDHCSLAGDTRYDRVNQIVQAAEKDAVVEKFLDGYVGKVLVAGSTWPPDEQLLARLRESKEWFPERIIIAPHEIHEEHLRSIEALFPDSIRYSSFSSSSRFSSSSSLTSPTSSTGRVLIIDNIGLLSKLYRYATVAYIGGGFGVGIHNILEAVAYGKPVVFGPNYHKFQEAHDLIDLGGCMIVDEHPDVSFLRKLFTDDDIYHAASDACLQLMRRNLGSTHKILNSIEA